MAIRRDRGARNWFLPLGVDARFARKIARLAGHFYPCEG
jgi:hypothetical protein